MHKIPLFVIPYPDELFYSIIARYSDRINYHSVQHVMDELFGNRYARPSVAFPTGIQQLVDRLPTQNITADDFIDRHTLFPFYAAFVSAERRAQIREKMKGNDNTIIAFLFGSARSATPPIEVFRYCPVCVEQDRQMYAETYWHRMHHIPGIHICDLHGKALIDTEHAINNQAVIIHADNVIEAGVK